MNGEYIVYDSEGKKLDVDVVHGESKLDETRIIGVEGIDPYPPLKSRLMDVVKENSRKSIDVDGLDLIKGMIKISVIRSSKSNKGPIGQRFFQIEHE